MRVRNCHEKFCNAAFKEANYPNYTSFSLEDDFFFVISCVQANIELILVGKK